MVWGEAGSWNSERLTAVLTGLQEETVLCIHQSELWEQEGWESQAGSGLSDPLFIPGGIVLALARIGLLKEVARNIPSCEDHACPLLSNCPYASDFQEGDTGGSRRPKRSRKFRPTPEGLALRREPERFAELVKKHPIVEWLARRFSEQPKWSRFALAEAWLEAALAQIREAHAGSACDHSSDSSRWLFGGARRELAACLTLLVGLGWLVWEDCGLTLRLADRWWDS